MKAEILTSFLGELERSSQETQRSRGFWAKKFLDFAGDKPFTGWNKGLVNAFEHQLLGEGYAVLTIRTALGIVKRVFDAAKAVHEAERTRLISQVDPQDPSAVAEVLKAMSLPGPQWDVGKRWLIRADTSDITRPALTLDELEKMVTTARNNGLELAQVCYLVLASIYGLRREELRQVRREHIDEKTIFVNTCKGGERRKQLLAKEIIPYLKEYDFSVEYSPFMMSLMFKKICAKSGVENRDGMGWHSFRRSLDSMLFDRFGELHAHIFLRWRTSSSSLMTERYYSVDPLEIDREVLTGGHPVVALWG